MTLTAASAPVFGLNGRIEPDRPTIRRPDGSIGKLYAFDPVGPTRGAAIVVMPAMGVAGGYYHELAHAFALAGRPVVIGELRGGVDSGVIASRGRDFGYRELIEEDWPLTLAAAQARFPGPPPVLLGHSLGGQLSLLYSGLAPATVSAVVTAAACSVHHSGYDGWAAARLWGLVRLAPLISGAVGHFPGRRLGFAGREAHTMMRDWSYEARTGRYRLTGSSRDWEGLLAGLKLPVLAISIDTDRLAPRRAVDRLAAKLKAAAVTRAHWRAEDLGDPEFDHFRWARQPAVFVARVMAWLDGRRL